MNYDLGKKEWTLAPLGSSMFIQAYAAHILQHNLINAGNDIRNNNKKNNDYNSNYLSQVL